MNFCTRNCTYEKKSIVFPRVTWERGELCENFCAFIIPIFLEISSKKGTKYIKQGKVSMKGIQIGNRWK